MSPAILVLALAGAVWARESGPDCRGPAGAVRPGVRGEVGFGPSYRWDSYTIASAAIGLDVPVSKPLSVALGIRGHTAGSREIWLYDFESRRAMVQGEFGLRWRGEQLTRPWSPSASLYVYGIPRVELGLQGELGPELWFDRRHALGLRVSGGAAWSPGRPVAPLAEARLLVNLEPRRAAARLRTR